ncbi:hypothetical protein PR048_007392 [Dryococelus australis]|uniref:Uncharacterized protein n=1 Tax=Dryococelus australis TaxID=614101 RepID=A0ABQ9HU45_9NEOP|nr:hypothetical protein PR048_007392 [Dryococelus australis]
MQGQGKREKSPRISAPPTSGVVQYDSYMPHPPPRIELGSPGWKASKITITSPLPRDTDCVVLSVVLIVVHVVLVVVHVMLIMKGRSGRNQLSALSVAMISSKLDIEDETRGKDDHEDNIDGNVYEDSVDEVPGRKYDDSLNVPTHFTNEFPSTSCVNKAEGEPDSIPVGTAPRYSHVVIVLNDATDQRVFSGISHFPHPRILALLHTYLTSPSSAFKTSISIVEDESMSVYAHEVVVVAEKDYFIRYQLGKAVITQHTPRLPDDVSVEPPVSIPDDIKQRIEVRAHVHSLLLPTFPMSYPIEYLYGVRYPTLTELLAVAGRWSVPELGWVPGAIPSCLTHALSG